MVEDRGVGLEPQALEHLFQPFFTQFDPSRHSSGDFGFCKRGLGLGLSIAKQFVEMHGGRIFAESVESGGTRVTVILPRGPRAGQDEPDGGQTGADGPISRRRHPTAESVRHPARRPRLRLARHPSRTISCPLP